MTSKARSTQAIKPAPGYARARDPHPTARPLMLGDAPGTCEPGFPADHPAVSTVGETLARFGLVPLSEIRTRPEAEQIAVALGNLDALAACALTRGRRWERKDGTPVVSPEPDIKGALAAQRAAHELLELGRGTAPAEDARPARDIGALLAEARLALSATH